MSKKTKKLTLHRYLRAKARLGIFDTRMASFYGASTKVNKSCKKMLCRAYLEGLVLTASTGGQHAPGSFHYKRNNKGEGLAVDIGNLPGYRRGEVHWGIGQERLKRFQRKEFWRRDRGKIKPVELIGPINTKVVLGGVATVLPEGSALENQHDDHVHEAYWS